MSKNILILTGSYGAGHNAATEALENTVKNYYKDCYVTRIDIVGILNEMISKFTKKYFEDFCQRYPFFWEKTFDIFDDKKVTKFLHGIKNPLLQKKFDKKVNDINPDIIINCFPFWQGIIRNYIKNYGKNGIITATVITDTINIHRLWYLKEEYMDYYFVIDEFTKNEMIDKFGPDNNNIFISFFPIEKEKFVNKNKICSKNIVLLLSNVEKDFSHNFLNLVDGTEFKINVLKGRNSELYDSLKYYFSESENIEFNDYINLKEEFKNIDIMIAKPGGALVSECIATDTPIIIPSYMPGQEEGNKILVEKNEVGIFENYPSKAVFDLKYMDWNKMLPNFYYLKNENSCFYILDKLLS